MKPVKKDTNRIAKINSLIQLNMGSILNDFLEDQNIMVTVTKVDTSKDMKWSKIWISIFHTKKPKTGIETNNTAADEKILNYLQKNIYKIQGELNQHFATKIIPKISFHLDTSPRYAEHIEEVIKKIHGEKE